MSTLTIKIKQYAVIFYISVYFSVYFDHLTEFPITRMPGCYLPLIDEKALNCKTRFNACIRDMLVFNNYARRSVKTPFLCLLGTSKQCQHDAHHRGPQCESSDDL